VARAVDAALAPADDDGAAAVAPAAAKTAQVASTVDPRRPRLIAKA
jgi:hypothetical protein